MASQRGYKRSWKNLLINKDYQLRMTMVLVGVSALLISGLGWWVMDQARTATEVAINNVEGTRCEKPAWMSANPTRVVVDEITAMEPGGTDIPPVDEDRVPVDDPSAVNDEPGIADKPDGKPAGDEAKLDPNEAADPAGGGEAGERQRPAVTITNSSMDLKAAPEPQEAAAAALANIDEAEKNAQEKRYHECELAKKAKVGDLRAGEVLILQVLVGLGLLMVIGLAAYGIKMTHKVAGPLFKIGLYLNKLENNTYDTVYNLRKGDHLVEFYAHFKEAHAGVKQLVEEDIEQLKAILEIAESENLASKSPELKASIAKLKELLDEKEKSLG